MCTAQRPDPDDGVGRIITEMGARADALRGAARPRGVSLDEVLSWAGEAGLAGEVHLFERRWHSSPRQELAAIAHRTWPALRELDEAGLEEVTRPAIKALQALPARDRLRRATAEMVVLRRA